MRISDPPVTVTPPPLIIVPMGASSLRRISRPRIGFGLTACTLAVITVALAPLLDERQITNVALLYLLATLAVAALWGYRVGIFAALTADILVNFFFIPPLHRFTVQRPENLVTLILFLAVALIGALMLSRFREQVARANSREAETLILLNASREVVREANPRIAIDRLCEVVGRALQARGCAILSGQPLAVAGSTVDRPSSAPPTREESAVALQAISSAEIVRLRESTATPSGQAEVRATFVPLPGGARGVLRLLGPLEAPSGVDGDRLLGALADEASLALVRTSLAREAGRAEALARAEEFKSVLLSSVSHDLRSPLTAIKAAVTSLRDTSVQWTEEDVDAFLETIESQTDRLARTVSNLLEMSRLESGVTARLEPIELRPLIDEALQATSAITAGRRVQCDVPEGQWARADYGLLLQAIANLIENAAKYSTPGSPIAIESDSRPGRVFIRVRDYGPGIPESDIPHIFEKFYRGSHVGAVRGTGLGLALVKAMVETCGGTISVESSKAGTVFEISLAPAAAPPPPES
jgi:two-component system sensor histidine kinase KdpD